MSRTTGNAGSGGGYTAPVQKLNTATMDAGGPTSAQRAAMYKAAQKPTPRPTVSAPPRTSAPAAVRKTSAPVSTYKAPAAQPVNRPPAAAPPRPAAPPVPPSIEQFLAGDTTYMGQNADLQKAMANFDTQQGQQSQQYGQEYNLNKGNLASALTEANTAMANDYGSRGMMNSGLYGQAYADQQTEYNGRQAALDNARTQFLSDQTAGKTNFTADQGLTAEKARQDAINRRAAGLGL
jgi:hypothetical protein